MKSPIILLLALLSFSMSCSSGGNEAPRSYADATAKQGEAKDIAKIALAQSVKQQNVSLTDMDVGSTAEAVERKIIRNAEITMEVSSTTDTQHRVASIADANGGFVVTSES